MGPLWPVVLTIIALLALGVAATTVYLPAALHSAAIEAAYRSNLETAEQIKIARGYYTRNVVAKALSSGALTPSYSYKDDPKAIPLPATFVQDMSDLLKERDTTLSLVSPYPWPHRAGRKMDDFETTAWRAFQQNNDPAAVFSREEVRDGKRVLRIAVPDRMTGPACVSCHNTHPESIKRDWKIGDVRAVMQVTKVVEPYLAAAERRGRMILLTVASAASVAAVALIVISIVVARRTREKRRVDRRVHYLAHHDALSGTLNRASFVDQLKAILRSRMATRERLAVHYIDLDGFKDVNDTLGHAVGDELIQCVAKRLRDLSGPRDLVARLGGDEFAMAQVGIATEEDASKCAATIVDALSIPFSLAQQKTISISASVGVKISSLRNGTADELIREADLALYHAKATGRRGYVLFAPEMGVEAAARRNLLCDLRTALATDQFEVHYQPMVEIETRRKIVMEALVRWRHPVHGLISPDRFIPLAEEDGLIGLLGELVLRQACRDAVLWPPSTKVSVNVSPAQFQGGDLASRAARILADSRLPPERLELEITETVLLKRREENLAVLHQLRSLGVSIALDDFGTGYSSLSYLQAFPLDKIKIDKSFISGITKRDECAAIACAVANLGRNLNIATVAEGVETEEQLELVRAAGFSQAQGFLFGRPSRVVALDFGDHVAGTPSADDAMLTARDTMLVRASFALVLPIQDATAGLFYDRLFAIAPELRTLFPDDLREQRLKLMAMLASGIGKLHQFDSLVPTLKALGARHAAYGTKPEHYGVVADALLWSLEKCLGDGFTPEIRSAWTKVYNALATAMQAGTAEEAAVRAA